MAVAKKQRRPRGWYSAAKLRERLAAWCIAHGGVVTHPEIPEGHVYEDGSVASRLFSATYRLPSTIGLWDVHLPDDSEILLHVNTRFVEARPPALPEDANPHSGKWNFNMSPPSDNAADWLFNDFTRQAERYVVGGGIKP